MNSTIIQHNMTSMNLQRQLSMNSSDQAKSTEKLSSGYKINKAADDAASMAVSEKMRKQIRGLKQGTMNAEDGISFVQTADGSLDEVTEMIQRMKELTIRSLNGTNTRTDREALEAEFNELQSEIDRVTKGTKFNTIDVFEQHEDTYYSVRGNRQWMHSQEHLIENGGNDFSFVIPGENGAPDTTYEITVPLGKYTTQELIDEMEDAFASTYPSMEGFRLEFDKDGYCNFNLEGGADVKSVGGSLSYLIYNSFSGGGFGSLLGTTQFVGNWPLVVSPYNNELKFSMEDVQGVSGAEITLRLDNGNYTRDQMIDHINQKLSAQGITDVSAKRYGDYCIQLGGEEHFITGLKGNMFEIDDGRYTSVFYDNVKGGSVVNTKGTFNGKAFLTTDPADTGHNRFVINSANKTLKIRVNGAAGTPYTTITLPEGSYTASQMAAELNNAFLANGLNAGVSVKSQGQFEYLSILSNLSGNGSKIEVDPTSSCYGTIFTETEYFNSQSVPPKNGYYTTVEPSVRGSKSLTPPFTITSPDNLLNVNVDGINNTLTLTPNTYATLDDLVAEINAQIASGAVAISGKIKAVNDGNHLLLTTSSSNNGVNSISVSNGLAGGSLYHDLFISNSQKLNNYNGTSYGTGSFQFPETQGANITIAGNNTLNFVVNNIRRTVSIPDGTYTQSQFATMIQNQLKGSSVTTIQDVNVSDRGVTGTIEGTTIPDPTKTRPAKIEFEINDVTKIDSSSNEFKFDVNGTTQTITLTNGTYTRQQLMQEMNKLLTAAGIDATASLSGSKLCFTTKSIGAGTSLSVSSATGGSAMNALAKKTTTTVAGVKVSFVGNKLTISGETPGQTVQAGTNYGGSMMGMLVGYHNEDNPAKVVNRQTNSAVSYIDGVNITQPVTIDGLNKRVKFKYTHNGTDYPIDFDLAEKDYTFAQLQQELQSQINAATGGNSYLAVTVNGNGVRIQAPAVGSQYSLSGFSEGFHSYVISGSKIIHNSGSPIRQDGKQIVNKPYIMGRQDVKNKPVTIRDSSDPKGANNVLKLDFTVPDPLIGGTKTLTLELKLNPGTYQGQSLVSEVQRQLDKQLVNNGFTPGMIKANIGGIETGIVGSDDRNCINFSIPDTVPNIDAGTYRIDGVRGNAAYYVFYKTVGDPIPAYTIGSKDISKGVTIPPDKNVFSLEVDGIVYDYTFLPGKYTAQSFLDMFNDKLEHGDDTGKIANVKAAMADNNLRLGYTKMGDHDIKVIGSTARGQVFYEEIGRLDANTARTLLIGAKGTDTMKLETLRLNTSFLKINSICISGEKYAKKALLRLDDALSMVNMTRAFYGAKQNRLEHAVKGNNNTEENLTAAESRIRDTDIAAEMVRYSKNNIMAQFGQSLLVQANQRPSSVLGLLQ